MAILPNSMNTKTPGKGLRQKLGQVAMASLFTLCASSAMAADWTVQIGAFGAAPNPTFTNEASQHGEVLVNQSDDGITRVSVGRFESRSDARAALARLQIAGFTDAYITSTRSGLSAGVSSVAISAKTEAIPNRAGNQRLPNGRQIVEPKKPTVSSNTSSTSTDPTKAGRFRLRTHDTQSGQTSDLKLPPVTSGNTRSTPGVVAGRGANQIPAHLKNKLVYLDGVPHIKEGDQFIPLTDAIDGKP